MASSKHPHCEVIKAWADGAKIQVGADGLWSDTEHPKWYEDLEYRVKPEPKPDTIRYMQIESGYVSQHPANHSTKYAYDNVKAVFDGETGALKSVEIINGKQ